MINKNYIILASGSPAQLARLIKQLDDGTAFFYIHVDKKADINDFKSLLNSQNDIVFVNHREACSWGDFSLVQATLNAMQQLVEDGRKNYTLLLSESCYPIADNPTINKYLEGFAAFEHIDIAPAQKTWKNWEDRFFKYKINLSRNRSDYRLYPYFFKNSLNGNIKNLKEIIRVSYKRKNPRLLADFAQTLRKKKPVVPGYVGGSAWWGLSFSTLQRVLAFVSDNPGFIQFHKWTLLPDELFFQSIIHQLSAIHSDIQVKPSLTYVNWTRKDVTLPVTFNENDLDELTTQRNNHKLFARKFTAGYSDTILNALDASFKQVTINLATV